jgi:hypothetical protein
MAIWDSANQIFQAANKTLFESVVLNNESKYSAPFELAVARGKITGISGLSISGYNGAVDSNWQPIWEIGGAYTYFSSAQQVRIWSNNESDTNVSVLISGLDATYTPITETVVLTNGSTGVLSTKSFLRINNLSAVGTVNAIGTIRAGNSDKSITLAAIVDGAGRSQMSIYTVPAGFTFFLTQVNLYTNQNGNNYTNYRSYTQNPSGLTTKILQFPLTTSYNSVKVVARPYFEKTDIQWQASSSSTSQVGLQIEGYLIDNSI